MGEEIFRAGYPRRAGGSFLSDLGRIFDPEQDCGGSVGIAAQAFTKTIAAHTFIIDMQRVVTESEGGTSIEINVWAQICEERLGGHFMLMRFENGGIVEINLMG